MIDTRFILSGALLLFAAITQSDLRAQPPAPQTPQPPARRGSSLETVRPTYTLGVGDEITIHAPDVEEISDKPFRVDAEGNLSLPLLGTLPAAGVTVEQLESTLTDRLKPLVTNPQAVVSVVEYRNDVVFFQGAFNSPGIHALQGRRKLVEMLAGIGGLQPNASKRIRVTRRLEFGPIPLPNVVVDRENNVSTVEISLNSLAENINPAQDITLQPFDVVRVDPSEMVYVNGEVTRAGGVELGERDSLSVTQTLAMAGGLAKDAAPEKARILRPILNTSRRAEIPVDIKKIMQGRATDFRLMPNDVLFVPRGSGFAKGFATVGLIAIPAVPTLLYVILR